MSNLYFIIAFRFVLILIVQGLIFNKFDLFGLYDPHISIIFVLIFPIKTNTYQVKVIHVSILF